MTWLVAVKTTSSHRMLASACMALVLGLASVYCAPHPHILINMCGLQHGFSLPANNNTLIWVSLPCHKENGFAFP